MLDDTKVKPGLVIINTALQYNSEASAGTGMVINADGLVLTNYHVLDDSTKITATVAATGRTYPVTVVGYDKTRDIALIQLQNASGLTTVPSSNSSSVKIGNAVVALGNAEGQASSTITIGYPPFVGIFISSGSSSSPQAQAQQEEQQQNGGGVRSVWPQHRTGDRGAGLPPDGVTYFSRASAHGVDICSE